jgi:hypothetical protein
MEFKRGIPRPEGLLDGQRNPNSKVTAKDVEDILGRRANGETIAIIAMDYPIGKSMISHICTGRNCKKPGV